MRKNQRVLATSCQQPSDTDAEDWIKEEVAGCYFQDVRHGKRLRQLLEQFSSRIGATTPWATQDWANTKAAYRFFANDRICDATWNPFTQTSDRIAIASKQSSKQRPLTSDGRST